MMDSTPPPAPDDAPSDDADDAPNAAPLAGHPTNRSAHSPTPSQSAQERQTLLRLASSGFELATYSLVLGGAGYGLDHWLGNATPYFAIAGILLGFSLGFYRLIVMASKIS
ncbi:AtpZ/AtpI family protein [Allorhodopirellula heiligendammensis]|uniref:F0F1-ATPase subunit (ATPase_gene1) n=1 Tax=Allorhodopirellula heiligendammensis TaxID=2714739 RepID=A0A5C6C311_9BACT|nr:AtpZ/AtpI family protein [Allorhodopirellula heiligendammensis]TWU18930.1 hypothetical protein Poly21_11010 [Allorhodopirellula heiligendammensis]